MPAFELRDGHKEELQVFVFLLWHRLIRLEEERELVDCPLRMGLVLSLRRVALDGSRLPRARST